MGGFGNLEYSVGASSGIVTGTGTIPGVGISSDFAIPIRVTYKALSVQSVPEPPTIALIGIGLVGAGYIIRKKGK